MVALAAAGLSLAVMACLCGGLPTPGNLAQNVVEEQGQTAAEEAVEAQVEQQIEEQLNEEGVDLGLGDECPVLTAAEYQAATGMAVTYSVTAATAEGLVCSITTDEAATSIQVFDDPEAGDLFNNYATSGMGAVAGDEGVQVSGPWDQGVYFPGVGMVFQKGNNLVLMLDSTLDQNAATAVASSVTGRLPWTYTGA